MKTRLKTHILFFLMALMSAGIKAAVAVWPVASEAAASDTAGTFIHLSASDYPITAAGLPRLSLIHI